MISSTRVYEEMVYKTTIVWCIERRAMFRRPYSHEFDAEEQMKILERLGRDS